MEDRRSHQGCPLEQVRDEQAHRDYRINEETLPHSIGDNAHRCKVLSAVCGGVLRVRHSLHGDLLLSRVSVRQLNLQQVHPVLQFQDLHLLPVSAHAGAD